MLEVSGRRLQLPLRQVKGNEQGNVINTAPDIFFLVPIACHLLLLTAEVRSGPETQVCSGAPLQFCFQCGKRTNWSKSRLSIGGETPFSHEHLLLTASSQKGMPENYILHFTVVSHQKGEMCVWTWMGRERER